MGYVAGMWLSFKILRERQISHDFTHMWNLRNLTDDHRGREGKIRCKQREANHRRLIFKGFVLFLKFIYFEREHQCERSRRRVGGGGGCRGFKAGSGLRADSPLQSELKTCEIMT